MGATAATVSLTTSGAEVLHLMVHVAMTVGLPAVKRLRTFPDAPTVSAAEAFAASLNPAKRTHTRPAKGSNLVSILASCRSCVAALKEY